MCVCIDCVLYGSTREGVSLSLVPFGVSGGGRTREAQRENVRRGDGYVEIHRSASVYPPYALITQFCFSPAFATDAAALSQGCVKIYIYFFLPRRTGDAVPP